MATEKAFVEELVVGLQDVRVYPMMGEYVLYCKEKAIGCICDNKIYVKITPVSKSMLEGAPTEPPYQGAKERFVVLSREKEFLQELFTALADSLPAPKKRA